MTDVVAARIRECREEPDVTLSVAFSLFRNKIIKKQ